MSALRALQAFQELLRLFHKELAAAPMEVEESFERGIGFLAQRLHFERVSLFVWEAQRQCFSMRYGLHRGILMEGEEEIVVEPHSALKVLIEERRPIVVSEKNPWAAFVPLQSGTELIGAVRFERRRPLSRGHVLRPLPSLAVSPKTTERRYPLLEDLSDVLSLRWQQLSRDEKHRKRAEFLRAGTDVATAVFERPRLRDMLEAVSRSIVTHLGFDRIRFYLRDPDSARLVGALGLQIPGRLLDLGGESFALKPNTNPIVDVVLAHDADPAPNVRLVGGRIVYVPLVVSGSVVGCIAVDNLLSQQLVNADQLEALRVLSGQIGMAIVNARLFEDIERQAITDGLTKLYVHRYFQQRLKEEIDRADRYDYSVALIMMDVDNFKSLNDRYGHLTGDRVLEVLSACLRQNIRRIDLAARYGGDEVVLLLPEITDSEALAMGERLQSAVRKCVVAASDGSEIQINVTMGAALYRADARSGRDLVEAADKALYWAKRNRRGSLCFYRSISAKTEKVG